jgi:hypothetical protein
MTYRSLNWTAFFQITTVTARLYPRLQILFHGLGEAFYAKHLDGNCGPDRYDCSLPLEIGPAGAISMEIRIYTLESRPGRYESSMAYKGHQWVFRRQEFILGSQTVIFSFWMNFWPLVAIRSVDSKPPNCYGPILIYHVDPIFYQ